MTSRGRSWGGEQHANPPLRRRALHAHSQIANRNLPLAASLLLLSLALRLRLPT